MVPALRMADVQVLKGEPRMADIRLAEALGFDRPRDIRKLIERCLSELEGLSEVCATVAQSTGGRPGTEYWLTEPQALLIAMRSDAPRAADCRAEIIAVFMAYRHGELVPVSPGIAPITIDTARSIFREEIQPLCKQVERMDGNIVNLRDRVDTLHDRVDDIVPRRDFPESVSRVWDAVLIRTTGGKCPCGCGTRILNEDGKRISGICSNDHWYGRERNGMKDGWPAALKCNRQMKDHAVRRSKEHRFHVFQEEVDKEVEMAKQTKPNADQLYLEF